MALPLAPQRPTLSVQSATSEGQAMLTASTGRWRRDCRWPRSGRYRTDEPKWRGANPIGPPSRSNRRRRPERAGDHPAMSQRHLRRRVGLFKNRSTPGGRIRGSNYVRRTACTGTDATRTVRILWRQLLPKTKQSAAHYLAIVS